MAQDAYVKEAESLTGFAADLRNAGTAMAGHVSRLSAATFAKESDLRVCVNRIEAALREAEERLEQAQYEYDSYMHHTDEENFSQSVAYSLRAEVEDAQSRCREIAEDLNYARLTLNEALFVLANLRGSAEAFSSRAQTLADSAAANVDAAAFEIIQYKSIR